MRRYILRAVFNRPEMLYLSLESEARAREEAGNPAYTTLFAVELGASAKCLEIIEKYPYPKEVVMRKTKHHGWGNILEGFKQIFDQEDVEYALNIEDDCLLHPTYFKYMEEAFNLVKNIGFSTISASRRHIENRRPSVLKAQNLFEAPACLMGRYFFNKYVRPYATYDYYRNRQSTIHLVNKRTESFPEAKYSESKRNAFAHVGWDGLVNRLIDAAFFEEGIKSYSPFCDRQIHIGFYGQNRLGRFPSNEKNFTKRVDLLREITSSAESMQSYDPVYKDYVHFSSLLDDFSKPLVLDS